MTTCEVIYVEVDVSTLVRTYEASGDPGTISDGEGDLGGVSYGIYQLSSTAGSVDSFVKFCQTSVNENIVNIGDRLAQFSVNTDEFNAEWTAAANDFPDDFTAAQDAYAVEVYLDPAGSDLADANYDLSNHTQVMSAVVMSRAVQYSSGNVVELFEEAVARLGHPNLSYVNSPEFDAQLINEIYGFLIDECDDAQWNGSIYHSPKDWCNGSAGVINGLRNRFVNERADALALID